MGIRKALAWDPKEFDAKQKTESVLTFSSVFFLLYHQMNILIHFKNVIPEPKDALYDMENNGVWFLVCRSLVTLTLFLCTCLHADHSDRKLDCNDTSVVENNIKCRLNLKMHSLRNRLIYFCLLLFSITPVPVLLLSCCLSIPVNG